MNLVGHIAEGIGGGTILRSLKLGDSIDAGAVHHGDGRLTVVGAVDNHIHARLQPRHGLRVRASFSGRRPSARTGSVGNRALVLQCVKELTQITRPRVVGGTRQILHHPRHILARACVRGLKTGGLQRISDGVAVGLAYIRNIEAGDYAIAFIIGDVLGAGIVCERNGDQGLGADVGFVGRVHGDGLRDRKFIGSEHRLGYGVVGDSAAGECHS